MWKAEALSEPLSPIRGLIGTSQLRPLAGEEESPVAAVAASLPFPSAKAGDMESLLLTPVCSFLELSVALRKSWDHAGGVS